VSAAARGGWLTSGSVQSSLRKALAITTGGALALVAAALLMMEVWSHRQATETNLRAVSAVIGLYSEAALEFDDPAAGREALDALQTVPQIEAGILFDEDGKVFATFGENADALAADASRVPGISYGAAHLDLATQVNVEGKPAGLLWIRRGTSDLASALATKSSVVGVVMAATLALSFILANRLGRHIARPLEEQVAGSAAVAGGDLSVQVAETASGELGELGRAFNTMTAGLRGLVSQVGQGVAEVLAVSRTLEERGRQLGQAASRQASAIGEATSSVGRVSQSIREVNQSVEEIAHTADETSSSAVEMDASIGEVAARMNDLTGAIATTSAAVTQVTSSIRKISKNAETLQEATNGTAQHLEELTSTVSSVASKATESLTLSEASSRAADEGMTVVQGASSAMDAISTSFRSLQDCVSRLEVRSRSIDEIVQVITGVADETKLLALNASIIAAQAGDEGKAFSVVARQVRELAERTHRSAGEITGLVRATQEDTSAAVSAAQEGSTRISEGVQRAMASGEVLKRIHATSTNSAARAREIADATAQQARDLDRVGVAVREIDGAVQAIRRSTKEQELSSEEIAKAIESIRDLGLAVQDSTQQQRNGSSMISKASIQVSETLSQIVDATNAQSRSGQAIEQTLGVFSEVSAETVKSAEAITAAVETLLKRAKWLEEESRRFRTTSN
jgi:methyl-accepting chemotaxis protein